MEDALDEQYHGNRMQAGRNLRDDMTQSDEAPQWARFLKDQSSTS